MTSILNNKLKKSPKTSFKAFLVFFIGQMVSIFGSSIVMFVITWHITDIDVGNNTILSLAFFTALIPTILLTPIAGAIADKYNKKIIIIVSDSLQALFTFGAIMLFYFGNVKVWHILMLNFLRSAAGAFHSPAAFAITPLMVPKEKLAQMNGLKSLIPSLIHIISPMLAAFLMTFFKIENLLWIDILTFGFALMTIISIRIPSINQEEKRENKLSKEFCEKNSSSNPSLFSQIQEGFTTIGKIPGLKSIFILAILGNFLAQPITTLLPNFIRIEHNGSEQNLGYFMGALEGGLVIGALITTMIKHYKNVISIISVSFYSMPILFIVLGLIPEGNFIFLYIIAICFFLLSPISNTLFVTSLQIKIPPEKMGRVYATVNTISQIAMPLGMLLSGIFADLLKSIKLLYIICGILMLIVISALLYSKNSIIYLKSLQEEHDEIYEKSLLGKNEQN
jgi:MFS transporter, DHA3 family, macrolide efflux protein